MTAPAGGYGDERARFYHEYVSAADLPDVDYYVDLALDAGGPVLEAACGTGRVYLELCRAGVGADGFDRSAAALTVLRDRAAESDLDPTVWRADLTAFAVDREYALVTCPFNAFQHLRTVDDQLAALEAAHDALAPGGRFVFDVFVPDFEVICGTYGEWRTETVEYRGEPHEVRSRTRIVDEVAQRFEVETELYDPDGTRVFAETDRLAMLPAGHVELLARCSPFDEWRATGDFADEPLADGHSVQVWTLRKGE